MKALNTLRNLIFLLFFAAAAASVSAADGDTRPGKPTRKSAVEHSSKAQRNMVAPFVDPTLPLTEFVERIRTDRAR